MRATPPSFALAPTFRRRMRSGETSGRRALPYGIGWLLLALVCLLLALAAKAEPNPVEHRASHSGAQLSIAERTPPIAGSASGTTTMVPASNDGRPEALPAISEPPAEKDPSGDRHRRPHATGFPALAKLARAIPVAAVTRDGGTGTEGRLPPAHAPPATC
jgi:hypothetical protein